MYLANSLTALALLMVANGSPVLASNVLGRWLSYPLDGNLRLADRSPLFSASKTVRGIVFAVLATVAVGVLLDLDWKLGFVAGSTAGRRSVLELHQTKTGDAGEQHGASLGPDPPSAFFRCWRAAAGWLWELQISLSEFSCSLLVRLRSHACCLHSGSETDPTEYGGRYAG